MTRELIIECMVCNECQEENSCFECADKQLTEYEKQIRADAIEEVKSKMISFHTDAIFQYGADIIEARADAFDELKDWVEEQIKEQS